MYRMSFNYDALANCMTELLLACDLGAAALGWLSLKYSLRFRGGNVLLSRSAKSKESLSGEDERSGDSGEDRGGVSSRAASTHRTRFDGLQKKRKYGSLNKKNRNQKQ